MHVVRPVVMHAMTRARPGRGIGAACWQAMPVGSWILVFCLAVGIRPFPVAATAAQQISAASPRLIPMFTTVNIDDAPLSVLAPLAVNGYGETLYRANEANDVALILVDSVGAIKARFGVPGDGPGEVREPRPIGFDGEAFVTWDPASARMARWSRQGTLVASSRLENAPTIVAIAPEGYLAHGRDPRTGARLPVLISAVGVSRNLIHSTPPADVSAAPGRMDMVPVLGTWSGGFVTIDASRYRGTFYRWNGTAASTFTRPAPTMHATAARVDAFVRMMPGASSRPPEQIAAIREQAAGMALPPIVPGITTGTDDRGRTWVMGFAGDSAFADVFESGGFIARVAVPCHIFQGSFSVAGHWLATACLPEDGDFLGDAVLRVFRIEG